MLNITGNLCEMGELEMDPGGDGFRIERADGSVVTIVGLTHEEVRGLKLFADVTLSVTDSETERATTPGATT
jgi:hypothetical protein